MGCDQGARDVQVDKIRVSLAVPCYNGALFLDRTIESLLAQTRPADEILVIDDGSTDDSARIAERYPVHLIQHPANRGLAAARNTAMSIAEGDILVYVDVDALADPDLLSALLAGYTGPDVGGVGGQGIEANIQSVYDRWRQLHASQGHGSRPRRDCPFLYGLCMSFRIDALREIGGFDPAFRTNAEDVDVSFRLTAAGYRLHYVPEARVYHQRTDDKDSLLRTMAAWYRGAYHARRRNGRQPWRLYVGTARRLATEPMHDLFVQRDPALARLSLTVGLTKISALWQARQESSGG